MNERIVILDRGNVEIAIPERWTVTPKVEGHLDIRDPTDACKLEISYLRLPPLKPGIVPPVGDMLAQVLAKDHREPPIVTESRGSTQLAWAEYAFEEHDPSGVRAAPHEAAGCSPPTASSRRCSPSTTGPTDDAAWAAPAWERVVATLALGDGRQLASPAEHWALREKH